MQQKIKLVVQGTHEDAYEFSSTLENISKSIQESYGLNAPPHIHAVTSSSDGRHSVMFTWVKGLGYGRPPWKSVSEKPTILEKVIVKLVSGIKLLGFLDKNNKWVICSSDGFEPESNDDKVIEWTEMP